MTAPVGGRRARLIRYAVEVVVREGLAARGWLDADRRHQPIRFASEPTDREEPIPVNTLSVSSPDVDDVEAELGSSLTEETWTFYVDFYAENESLGLDVIHDVRDILRGKMPSIGRSRPIVEVWDWSQATPPYLFACDIERVIVDRGRGWTQPWLRHWFTCRFDVVDHYGSDDD